MPLFTIAVLHFRKLYKTRNWNEFSTGKTIPLIIIYGIFFGFIVTISMLALTVPFVWEAMFTAEKLKAHNTSLEKTFTELILGNTFSTSIFISLWAFIYVGITTKKQAEITHLKLQNSLKEAQLSSLSNQLNPHFLFNALNNIRFMIHENAQSADNMITSLSDILRYSLETSRQEKVWLSQEVEIINRYITLVKTQLENRLNFSLHIPDSHLAYLVPPMVLQMLVENAVKHGLDNMKDGGKLIVESKESNNKLLLSVCNDLPEHSALKSDNMGIGLKNIRQRLMLLYGDKAEIDITQNKTHFSVTLSLPKELN
jgi:LytS/YehU family sensor histidine kinase